MTGQANQRRLASAAATLPRQPRLVNRGGVRGSQQNCGPSIHPPSLPRGPSLADCIYVAPDSNGTNMQMVRVRAKIYPPVPPANSGVSSANYISLFR